MRYRLYIDEVGHANTGASLVNENKRYLSLTGVAFEEDYMRDLVYPAMDRLRTRYFNSHPDDRVIFHRKEMVNKRPPFDSLRNSNVQEAFNADFLSLVRDLNYVIFTVVIDKWEHVEKYHEWAAHPYHYCLEVLLERYQRWLRRMNAVGDVMAESRGKREDIALAVEYANIWVNGTSYVSHKQIQAHLTSKQLKLKPKSSNTCGLQFADLLAHPSYKWALCCQNFEPAPGNFGGRIAAILEELKYDRSTGGKVDGWGRKWLP